MEEWKFLLQKDGDRSWLPLDSPDVEILEGRYRIVAQTSHNSTDINIRICHLATEEDPPKRRIQKRSNRSNTNGLMVVIPFTHLQAGLWEFSCFLADPMSDLVGDTLHHAVRLQVSACVSAEYDDWEEPQAPVHVGSSALSEDRALNHQTESSQKAQEMEPVHERLTEQELTAPEGTPNAEELAALNLEIAEALGLSMDRLVEMTNQLSHQLVEEIFKEFNFVPQEIASKPAIPEATEATVALEAAASSMDVPAKHDAVEVSAPIEDLPPVPIAALQLTLSQDIWIARRGEALTISGQIAVDEQYTPEEHDLSSLGAIAPSEVIDPVVNSVVDPALVDLEGAEPQEIHLRLRDPQTSKVVFTACQAYPTGSLPHAFNFLCRLPEDLTTHLVLGEMLLCGTLPGAESALITLKSFNFTVTVDPEGLVEELQKVKTSMVENPELDDLPDFVTEFSTRLLQEQAKRQLDISFLKLTTPVSNPSQPAEKATVKASSRMPRKPSKQIFPPQIYQPTEVQSDKRKVELPAFATVGAKQASHSTIAQLEVEAETPEFAFATSALELESMLVAEPIQRENDRTAPTNPPEASFPGSPTEARLETEAGGLEPGDFADHQDSPSSHLKEDNIPEAFAPEDLDPETDLTEERVKEDAPISDVEPFSEPAPSSPIKTAFQSLNLQERFLTRLNSLAADSELLTLLKPSAPLIDEAETDDHEGLQAIADSDAELQLESDVEQQPETTVIATTDTDINRLEVVQEPTIEEVVVDDDPAWREWVKRAGSRSRKAEPDKSLDQDLPPQTVKKPLVLPLEQPVPMPILELVTRKAIAGRPISVRVKLPNESAKVYVKLWVNDRQTRVMLDGPRWLVDFLPTGFDELEANTQITAPFGSLGVRLEAIAVEMHSQRESQKVSIDCEVLPPDVPDELFDELDLI